jgi:3-phenylpropionate/trans-cinnamate dioxygenase ferredoxin reductase component
MRHETNVVIVGGGAAGHAAASTLRNDGHAGRITMVHGESRAPYNRTLVDKAILPGLLAPEQIALPDLSGLGVEHVTAQAHGIDPSGPALLLDGGRRLPYGAVVVATGSAPRGEADGGRVFVLHTVDDAVRIRESLDGRAAGAVVTVLGAGFIGAETASAFAAGGTEVHLVSRPEHPLERVLGSPIAKRVNELHREHLEVYFGRELSGIDQGRDSVTVALDDGRRIESDIVIVAHGTAPASDWVTAAAGGVHVDDRLRAVSVPSGYAAGSVAAHTSAEDRRYRIDHWDAAAAQGAHAARTLLHDRHGASDPGPYAPATGFTLNLYGTPIAAYGVALPGAAAETRETDTGIVTEFRDHSGRLNAAAGLRAGRELHGLRGRLVRP